MDSNGKGDHSDDGVEHIEPEPPGRLAHRHEHRTVEEKYRLLDTDQGEHLHDRHTGGPLLAEQHSHQFGGKNGNPRKAGKEIRLVNCVTV